MWTYFVLPLGVAVTLNSTAPIWSIPVAKLNGERVGPVAAGGAVMASVGVWLLVIGQHAAS